MSNRVGPGEEKQSEPIHSWLLCLAGHQFDIVAEWLAAFEDDEFGLGFRLERLNLIVVGMVAFGVSEFDADCSTVVLRLLIAAAGLPRMAARNKSLSPPPGFWPYPPTVIATGSLHWPAMEPA